jgi:hypothetical protein
MMNFDVFFEESMFLTSRGGGTSPLILILAILS